MSSQQPEQNALISTACWIAAFPKLFFPFVAIFPGLIILTVFPHLGTGSNVANSYNMAIPYAMAHFFPSGLLGVGLTALLASFMSGMAGNVTAFNTVWTYDIYRSYIRPNEPDRHYLNMGRIVTVAGVLISVGTAYLVFRFASIMDYVQLLFSFFNAPLFATFLLGMFWKRATGWGGFTGLVAGTASAIGLWSRSMSSSGSKGGKRLWRQIVRKMYRACTSPRLRRAGSIIVWR